MAKKSQIFIYRTLRTGKKIRVCPTAVLWRGCSNYSYADGTNNSGWEWGRDGGWEGEGQKRRTDRSCSFSHFHPMATNVFFLLLYTDINGKFVGIRVQWSAVGKDATNGRTRTREQTDNERNTTRED